MESRNRIKLAQLCKNCFLWTSHSWAESAQDSAPLRLPSRELMASLTRLRMFLFFLQRVRSEAQSAGMKPLPGESLRSWNLKTTPFRPDPWEK